MTKRFDAYFSGNQSISPSRVFVSPCTNNAPGYIAGILYPKRKAGTFATFNEVSLEFDLEQKNFNSEQDAIEWAKNWLTQKAGCDVTLRQI
ncbi:hypothetical protein [Aeromonas veronii]|uniref:hypothetical protein n=1 Tax=Aeromonas veronii TaxID=654 RepID=UPI003D1D45B3